MAALSKSRQKALVKRALDVISSLGVGILSASVLDPLTQSQDIAFIHILWACAAGVVLIGCVMAAGLAEIT